MKRAALLLVLLLIAPGAEAQTAQPSALFIQQMTAYFQKIANSFGCPKLGLSNFNQPTGVLEFLPPGQQFQNWSRLFTANIFPLPMTESAVAKRMLDYREHLLKNFQEQASIIDQQDFTTLKGLPVTYIEYRAGSGAETEHAVGVFARHSQVVAAFTQVQVRLGPLGDADRAAMKKFAASMTQQ